MTRPKTTTKARAERTDTRTTPATPQEEAFAAQGLDALLDELLDTPESRARYEAKVAEIDRRQEAQRVSLAKLRRARELTQATLAEVLDMSQGDVSKIEHRQDLLVSTLRRFVEATGGRLEFVALYDDAPPILVDL